MGTGYHGGFGHTSGSTERNRMGKPVDPMPKTYEMALNPESFSKAVVKRYNINLRGSKKDITIVFNSKLKCYGRVKMDRPNVIEIGPMALVNEAELANTIAHELNHARSFLKGGEAPEPSAYRAGNALQKYIMGEK